MTPHPAPTVSRIVHLHLDGRPQPVAVIITEVLQDGYVRLCAFLPSQLPGYLSEPVPYAPTPTPGCWTWPPVTTPRREPMSENTTTKTTGETVAMRPEVNPEATEIVIEVSTEELEDDADEDSPEDHRKASREERLRACARDALEQLDLREAELRVARKRGERLHMIAADVADTAESTLRASRSGAAVWAVAVIFALAAVIAAALGAQLVALILLGLSGLFIAADLVLSWRRGLHMWSLQRRAARLTTELQGPAL